MRVFHVKHSGNALPPRWPPRSAAMPRAPWRRRVSCPVRVHLVLAPHRAPPEPIFSRSHVSPCALLRAPSEPASSRGCPPPRPPPSRPSPPPPRSLPPRPSLPFSCGLLRFPGLLATMFHVKHSSAFALASISGSAFAHRPPRLSRVFVAALSLAPRALVRLLACPFLLRAPRLRPISLPHAFPSPAPPRPVPLPSRSRPLSVLPHTFLMITRGLLNLLPRYSVG